MSTRPATLKAGKRVEPVTAFNMHGWRVRRPTDITAWKGTIDPNYVHVFVAERKQGITLHLWSPYETGGLKQHEADLKAAGFKVMVGCLQFNRKAAYPVHAVVPVLASIAAQMKADA